MKRSQVNAAIDAGREALAKIAFRLPDCATWSVERWRAMRAKVEEVVRVGMGWDVTDFGSGDFAKVGATIFTIRNGDPAHPEIGVPYAEKVIVLTEGQTIPLHYHVKKTEDIINRGNGVLCVQIYQAAADDGLDKASSPRIRCDGMWRTHRPGETFEVTPGNSITLVPRMYHTFWAKKGAGTLVCGEVSSTNDDKVDNRFLEPLPRFSSIEEDEAVRYVLCNEYDRVLGSP